MVHMDVDTTEDGQQAVDMFAAAAEGTYDLILMDIQMPELDGYQATNKIRNLERRIKQISIYAMTANALHGRYHSCIVSWYEWTYCKAN